MSFAGVDSLDAVTLALLCALVALLLAYFRYGAKSQVELNFPPGPTPLPIIGNLHILDQKKLQQNLMEVRGITNETSNGWALCTSPTEGLAVLLAIQFSNPENMAEKLHNSFATSKENYHSKIPLQVTQLPDLETYRRPIIVAGSKSWNSLPNSVVGELRDCSDSRKQLAEKYGPIFSIKLGTTRAVVLTGYETVKDALINHPDQFAGRPHIPIFDDLTHGYGIVFGNGESWRQMRRFTMSTLRDFGMGKKTVEDKIIEEAHFLIKMFESHKGQEFNPTVRLNAAVGNIICSIVFGDRFDYDEQTFIILIHKMNENLQLAGSLMIQLYNALPILGFLPGAHKKICKNQQVVLQFIKDFIAKNYQTLDTNDPRSFIDVFMLKQQQESGNPNTYFHENNLIGTVADLFAAGMETTSITLRWAMLFMMKYPQIQEKVHDEITTVIGSERIPRTEDRKNLPYTNAVIHEIQRFANILPLNLMHSTTEDVNFKGYFLPKGTPVISLLTSVLYDKTQWKTPNDFDPSNFLDDDGKFVTRDAFVPFSMGRRACAGESLARMELFLFFTILIQRFRFQVPPGVTNLELVPRVDFVLVPKYQNVCAVRR